MTKPGKNQSTKYKVICFIPVEPEKQEHMSLEKAVELKEHLEAMQPENIYKIEPEPPSEKEYA